MSKQRRNIPSLYDLSKKSVRVWIVKSIKSPSHFIAKARKLLRKTTFPLIREQLLQELLPFDNHWEFGCLQTKKRSRCRSHQECVLQFSYAPKILKFLFGADMQTFKMDLKKIAAQHREETFRTLTKAIKMSDYTRLKELHLPGGSAMMDEYLEMFEDLCYYLKNRAPFLNKLHLPIASNKCFQSLSKIPDLQYLVVDRSRHFNLIGLSALCDEYAFSRFSLRILHIGVFKHHGFSKSEVSHFLAEMPNLISFSLMDEDRGLLSNDQNAPLGAKVFTYSALKLAITKHAFRNGHQEPFVCPLQELSVVDRQLKPEYLLVSCPNITKLHLDWQEELTQPPYNKISPKWFPNLLQNPDWRQLCKSSLTELSITFPAAHSPEGYSCPSTDFIQLMKPLTHLKNLTLKGMINPGHVSILDFLFHCPNLEELILDRCSVFLPNPNDYPDFPPPHTTLKKMHLVNKTSSFLVSQYITKCIVRFMPKLQEIVLRPEAIEGHGLNTPGLLLEDLHHLAALQDLVRLEAPISTEDCINNMPEFVYVLRDFPKLRHLTVSWGKTPPEVHFGRKFKLVEWLRNVLQAENANISVQFSHALHASFYSNPPSD